LVLVQSCKGAAGEEEQEQEQEEEEGEASHRWKGSEWKEEEEVAAAVRTHFPLPGHGTEEENLGRRFIKLACMFFVKLLIVVIVVVVVFLLLGRTFLWEFLVPSIC
jgi:hypothetical protein